MIFVGDIGEEFASIFISFQQTTYIWRYLEGYFLEAKGTGIKLLLQNLRGYILVGSVRFLHMFTLVFFFDRWYFWTLKHLETLFYT